jgi:hypothetical protein
MTCFYFSRPKDSRRSMAVERWGQAACEQHLVISIAWYGRAQPQDSRLCHKFLFVLVSANAL